MSDEDFHSGIQEVPVQKGYIPAESRFPTADEACPPSGGSAVTPPSNSQNSED